MSIMQMDIQITRKWLMRQSKEDLVSLIYANLDRIDLFTEDINELVRQMRERASFADTSATLSRLLQTWAEVLEGRGCTGWAAINREDLKEAKECRK